MAEGAKAEEDYDGGDRVGSYGRYGVSDCRYQSLCSEDLGSI